jgi:hypothetical protein
MSTEVVFQDKQLLVKRILGGRSVLLLDHLFPHSHELPLLELLEEAQFFYMVVTVTLDQPLAEGDELNGRVLILIEGQTFSGESVILLRLRQFVATFVG